MTVVLTDHTSRLSSVLGELNYLEPLLEKPFSYSYDPPKGVPCQNYSLDVHSLSIHDMRPIASDLSLDTTGFMLLKQEITIDNFEDEKELRCRYYTEVEGLLMTLMRADRVIAFNHTIRRSSVQARDAGYIQPVVRRVHVDGMEKIGVRYVQEHFPDEAERLFLGRMQMINVWRPIHRPAVSMPLAVCDGSTVCPEQLVPCDLFYPDVVGRTYLVTYDQAHRWFYVPEMDPSELLVLKCLDSSPRMHTRCVPHTSFVDPNTSAGALARESVEVRALVFHLN